MKIKVRKLRITEKNNLVATIKDDEMDARIWVLSLETGWNGKLVVPRTATE